MEAESQVVMNDVWHCVDWLSLTFTLRAARALGHWWGKDGGFQVKWNIAIAIETTYTATYIQNRVVNEDA